MSMASGQMSRFEEMNNCKINFFEYGNKVLVPFCVGKKFDTDFDVDLRLLEDGVTHQYVRITNSKKVNLPREWSNIVLERLSLPTLLSYMFFKGNLRATHRDPFQQ